MTLSKSKFVDIINELKINSELANDISNVERKIRSVIKIDMIDSCGFMFVNEHIVVDLLKVIFDDDNDWIEYYLYELDYGKKYYDGIVTFKNKIVKLATAEDLYELLMTSYK